MVAVARRGVVGRWVECIFEGAHARPVALDPCVEGGERRIRVALVVDHQPAADDLRPFQGTQIRRDPALGEPRIGIGGEEHAIGRVLALQPRGAHIEGTAAGGADMGFSGRKGRLDQAQREGGERARTFEGAHRLDRAVGAVVHDDHDPQGRIRREPVLRGERPQQARQALGLVAGRDADDGRAGAHGHGVQAAGRSNRAVRVLLAGAPASTSR